MPSPSLIVVMSVRLGFETSFKSKTASMNFVISVGVERIEPAAPGMLKSSSSAFFQPPR